MRVIDYSTATQLACQPEAPRAARHFVARAIERAGGDHRFSDAELLVSELVTNVVLHTDCSHVGVTVVTDAGTNALRCSVEDSDPTAPAVRRPEDGRPGGRGLRIVDSVSSAWGCERAGTGKSVWFRLDASGGESA